MMNDQLEPTVFVIFGGAGDLTWRKLVPALFDLSQDRSLPAHFAIIAVDRIKLGDEALRRRLHDGVNQFSRFGKAKAAAWNQFAQAHPLPAGRFQEAADLRGLGQTMREAGKGMGHQSPSHLLHGHAAEHVRRNSKISRQGRTGARPGMGADRDRETDRLRSGIGPRPERHPRRQFRGIPNFPHRSLSGQGNGAEHSGVPFCQSAFRADLEPALCGLCDHHRRRNGGRRASRRLLRPRRRAARHGAESPDATALSGGDGADGFLSTPTKSATRKWTCSTRPVRFTATRFRNAPCADNMVRQR